MNQRLAKAQASIEQSQAGLAILHHQWKSYLLRLSYAVGILSLHQARQPMALCWRAMVPTVTTWKAVALVIGDSLLYVLGSAMSICLVFFLANSANKTFFDPWFLLASACMPAIVALRLAEEARRSDLTDRGEDICCLQRSWLLNALAVRPEDSGCAIAQPPVEDASTDFGFPIVIVFYGIVTACVWFMTYQAQQQTNNLRTVIRLRTELQEKAKQQQELSKSSNANNSKTK